MPNWKRALFSLVLVLYVVRGSYLIGKYLLNQSLFGIRHGLIAAALFISAYPVFGWKRNSPWPWLGRWSFAKWILAAIGVGVVIIVADALSRTVTSYFTN